METKILIIAIIMKADAILMRKKPNGSLPYKETWYLFGAELDYNQSVKELIKNNLKKQVGIDINIKEKLSWDTEIKVDHDGKEKLFVYLNVMCEYLGGELQLGPDIEKLEWVPIQNLKDYDIVPPTRKLFRKLGYLK